MQAPKELIPDMSLDGILPILVLYNSTLENSSTYRSFLTSSHYCLADQRAIAVYDNSLVCQVSDSERSQLLAYKHDPNNGGLSAAYNWALSLALNHGFTWLLLLDQDSELPISIVRELKHDAYTYDCCDEVAAVVPHVRDKKVLLSPSRVKYGRLPAFPLTQAGVSDHQLTAINSGALVRSSFVKSIGGFSSAYPLDSLDHWLFHQIHMTGKKVAISESVIEHDLSVSDYRRKVSLARYRSILSSEAAFITTYKSKAEIPIYLLRLSFQTLKQLLLYRNIKMARLTYALILDIAAHPSRSLERGS